MFNISNLYKNNEFVINGRLRLKGKNKHHYYFMKNILNCFMNNYEEVIYTITTNEVDSYTSANKVDNCASINKVDNYTSTNKVDVYTSDLLVEYFNYIFYEYYDKYNKLYGDSQILEDLIIEYLNKEEFLYISIYNNCFKLKYLKNTLYGYINRNGFFFN